MSSQFFKFGCDCCEKVFVTWLELACHEQLEHKHEAEGDIFVCGVKCEEIECGFRTPNYTEYDEHMATAHIGTMFCHYCDEGFLSSERLDNHQADCKHAHCKVGECPLLSCGDRIWREEFLRRQKESASSSSSSPSSAS